MCGGLIGQSTLRIREHHYGYDTSRAFVLVRADLDTVAGDLHEVRAGTQVLRLLERDNELTYERAYPAVNQVGDTNRISFTRLPLVHINDAYRLNRVLKKPAELTYGGDEATITSTIGIRWRGSYSVRFPKKSYDIEAWTETDGQQTRDLTFGSLRTDDDWVLDALYNEPLRVNAYVAHKLWLDMYTPYYQWQEEEARAGADVMWTEVFVNGRYHGVYLLSEQVDRKQLKLKKAKNGEIRGELYKAVDWTPATQFKRQPALPSPWADKYDGWELKHPEPTDSMGWEPLHHIIGFAAHSTDQEMQSWASTQFHLPNLIDYFLFINAITSVDNHGKNVYLARYRAGEPYFLAPWDLDASFGNRHDGKKYNRPDVWLSNNLLERLLALNPDRFADRFCDRYQELRSSLLDPTALNLRIREAVDLLEQNGVYEREKMAWPRSVDDSEDYRSYVYEWNVERIAILDRQVCDFMTSTDGSSVEGASLSVFPNPAADYVRVRHAGTAPTPYHLFDLAGKRVRSGMLAPHSDYIPVAQLPAGMYVLRTGQVSSRLIVR
jgi:hypothetical protein